MYYQKIIYLLESIEKKPAGDNTRPHTPTMRTNLHSTPQKQTYSAKRKSMDDEFEKGGHIDRKKKKRSGIGYAK